MFVIWTLHICLHNEPENITQKSIKLICFFGSKLHVYNFIDSLRFFAFIWFWSIISFPFQQGHFFFGTFAENLRVNEQEKEPQDADYYYPTRPLNNEIGVSLILARVSRSEYLKFSLINKRFLSLIKNGEIFKIRK